MKAMSCLIMAAIMVMACGSDDVTGPGTSEPDTTEEWEHTVTLQATVVNSVEDPNLFICWLEDGNSEFILDTLTAAWAYQMEGEPGDSLWLWCTGLNDTEWISVRILVDSAQVASSGPPSGPGPQECSYVIP